MKKLPFVIIHGIDHSVSIGGEQEKADIYPMRACGWVTKETKQGLWLSPMQFGETPDAEPDDEHNVTLFIAKTKGMKIRRLK